MGIRTPFSLDTTQTEVLGFGLAFGRHLDGSNLLADIIYSCELKYFYKATIKGPTCSLHETPLSKFLLLFVLR
jgi:hypothetical protein